MATVALAGCALRFGCRLVLATAILIATTILVATPGSSSAQDRTTCLLPLSSDAAPAGTIPGRPADVAMGRGPGTAWQAYLSIWQAHHADPADAAVRGFLGLPLAGSLDAQSRPGRSAPAWLGWRGGSFQQVTTPHFTILSRADPTATEQVAEDLERCYWVWTQMFFPLWESSPQIETVLSDWQPNQSIAVYLRQRSPRISVRRKLHVVLFRDANEYQRTLRRQVPGIERSTGYYSDQHKTTCLYASKRDDPATRRHEMVHQLFREATRSGLGRRMPGEQRGFWLIEGIAGYFESLKLDPRLATVGGWDSSRLQYARFRTLVLGDEMPIEELQRDGRMAAQRRNDLSRWYAHAIAQTHRLMDSGDPLQRQWLYHQLARQYEINAQLPAGRLNPQVQAFRQFLAVDDAHLQANRIDAAPTELCLAGCQVSQRGLATIPASDNFQWLDLTRLPVGNDAVEQLADNPWILQRLSLEGTAVDAQLAEWISKARNLRELDLSATAIDDSILQAIAGTRELEILFLTGTQITDRSIDTIAAMKKLTSVDVQLSGVTAAGVDRLRQSRPDLTINPLEIQRQ